MRYNTKIGESSPVRKSNSSMSSGESELKVPINLYGMPMGELEAKTHGYIVVI